MVLVGFNDVVGGSGNEGGVKYGQWVSEKVALVMMLEAMLMMVEEMILRWSL